MEWIRKQTCNNTPITNIFLVDLEHRLISNLYDPLKVRSFIGLSIRRDTKLLVSSGNFTRDVSVIGKLQYNLSSDIVLLKHEV